MQTMAQNQDNDEEEEEANDGSTFGAQTSGNRWRRRRTRAHRGKINGKVKRKSRV